MAEVWFYQLEGKTVDDVLPGLLARGLDRGVRMLVQTVDAERVKALSQKLWSHEDVSFLTHGFEGEPNPVAQPIYITATAENPNASEFHFFIDGAAPENLIGLTRASIMFDGDEETAIEQARGLWRNFKADGHAIKYWKQDADGRWKDQAAS